MVVRRALRRGALIGLVAVSALAPALAQTPDPLRDAYEAGMRAFHAADLEGAARHFEQAVALARERYGDRDPRLATDLNNLAEVYRLLGRFDEAEKLYLEALALDRAGRATDPAATAATLNNLALLYRARKRFDEAEALYRQAVQLLEGNLGSNHPHLARLLNNWAMLKLARGDPKAALELERRALELARRGLPADHPQIRVLERNAERIRSAVAQIPPMAPAAPAAGEPAAGGTTPRFAVHLASMGSEEAARAAAAALARRHPVLRGLASLPPERVEIAGRGTFWRVMFGPLASRREAAEICARARREGLDCFVRELIEVRGAANG